MEKFKFSLSVMKPEARQVYVFKIILWSSEDENFMAYLVDHLGVHCYYSGQFFFWFLKYDRSSRSLTFDISTYLHICRSIFFVFSFFAKNENIRTIFCKKKRNIAILPMKNCKKVKTRHNPLFTKNEKLWKRRKRKKAKVLISLFFNYCNSTL